MENTLDDRLPQRPRVEVEVPTAWCEHPLVGDVHKCFVANLFCVLARLNAEVVLKDIPSGNDFSPRTTDSLLFSYHSVGDVANVWRIKEGPLPYFFSFDRKGYSGWSEFARSADMHALAQTMDPASVEQILSDARRETVARNISKYPQADTVTVNLTGQFVFFPLQILNDTVLQLAKLDYLAVLDRAAEIADSRGELLLLKRHPLCSDENVAARLAALTAKSKYVQVTTASVHSCLAQAKSVICCNSGVGFEALLHGKPVFTFGDSDYGSATERIGSINEVEKAFKVETTVSPLQQDKLAAYFLTEYCFDARNLTAIEAKLRMAIELAGAGAMTEEKGQVAVATAPTDALAQTIAANVAHHPRIALLGKEIIAITDELDTFSASSSESATELLTAVKEGNDQVHSTLGIVKGIVDELKRVSVGLDNANAALNTCNSTSNVTTELRAALDFAKADALAWKSSFESIVHSRSWRVMAPLRVSARALRAGRRLARAIWRRPIAATLNLSVNDFDNTVDLEQDRKVIVDSDLFDGDWYLAQYGDVAQAQIDPLTHYLTDGAAQGRDPSAFFDGAWYLRNYPDVAQAKMNPLLHYIKHGSREGRSPHPLFDVDWFVVATDFEKNSEDTALAAYLRMAGKEKIWPANIIARCQSVFKLTDLSHLNDYLAKMTAG